MSVTIRPYRQEDAKAFAEVHYDAVHSLGKGHYPADVLDAWSTIVDDARIRHVMEAAGQETRIIAEVDGQVAGLGCVVPEISELRACYVASAFSGKGLGRRILNELEEIARSKGAKELTLDSSLNAKDFYEKNGYTVIEKTTHLLRVGVLIECYKMSKQIV